MSLKVNYTLPFVGSVMSSHSKLVRKSFPILVWLIMYDPACATGDRDRAENTAEIITAAFMA